jgi:DNA-binding NarL/FixJ family response regulator
VEAGATVLLDPQQLPAALLTLRSPPQASGSPVGFDGGPGNDPRVDSLVRLTTSERRVLFFLTQGRSAQEIADELSVSLTTVRSHIRSILRKTGVRSQLAAVAIANGQGCASDVRSTVGPVGWSLDPWSEGRAADGDDPGSED